jgi:hypothetical protein
MQPNDTLARYFGQGLSDFAAEVIHCGEGALLTLPGYVSAATIEFLAFESGMAKGLVTTETGLDTAVHRRGQERLLFVANPHDYPICTGFEGERFNELRDATSGEVALAQPETQLTVPAETILTLRVL